MFPPVYVVAIIVMVVTFVFDRSEVTVILLELNCPVVIIEVPKLPDKLILAPVNVLNDPADIIFIVPIVIPVKKVPVEPIIFVVVTFVPTIFVIVELGAFSNPVVIATVPILPTIIMFPPVYVVAIIVVVVTFVFDRSEVTVILFELS